MYMYIGMYIYCPQFVNQCYFILYMHIIRRYVYILPAVCESVLFYLLPLYKSMNCTVLTLSNPSPKPNSNPYPNPSPIKI